MTKYIIRLDDACEKMNVEMWGKMEKLLDKYHVKPLVGVIPCCKDKIMEKYDIDPTFGQKVQSWKKKGWKIALHGYDHVYITSEGGINPVNARSEFAGVDYDIQVKKIVEGISILKDMGVTPNIFFAPSHTFDANTIRALKENSSIRIISDTIARKPYQKDGITFVPQQSGKVRRIVGMVTTFCYHPNTMEKKDFEELELFLEKYSKLFVQFPDVEVTRKRDLLDLILKRIYFFRRKKLYFEKV